MSFTLTNGSYTTPMTAPTVAVAAAASTGSGLDFAITAGADYAMVAGYTVKVYDNSATDDTATPVATAVVDGLTLDNASITTVVNVPLDPENSADYDGATADYKYIVTANPADGAAKGEVSTSITAVGTTPTKITLETLTSTLLTVTPGPTSITLATADAYATLPTGTELKHSVVADGSSAGIYTKHTGSAITVLADGTALTMNTAYDVYAKVVAITAGPTDYSKFYTDGVAAKFDTTTTTGATNTVNAGADKAVTYGAANFTQAATATAGASAIDYTSSNASVATVNATTGEVTVVGVGEANITATVPTGTYDGTVYAEGTDSYKLTVNAKELSLTTTATKAYDKTATLSKGELASVALTDIVGSDDVSLDGITATYNQADAHTSAAAAVTGVTLTGAEAANYTLPTANVTITGSITAKELDPSALTVSRAYDGTSEKGAATISAGTLSANGDTITLSAFDGGFRKADGTTATANVNDAAKFVFTSVTLQVGGTDTLNYVLDMTTAATGSITKAAPLFAVGAELPLSAAKTGNLSSILTVNGLTMTEAGLTQGVGTVADEYVVYYWITTPAGVAPASCNCDIVRHAAHTKACDFITSDGVAPCDCNATNATATAKHDDDCAYGGDSGDGTSPCDCAIRDAATTEAQHAPSCAAITPTSSDWKLSNDAAVTTYLSTLAAGDTVTVLLGLPGGGTNFSALDSVSDTTTGGDPAGGNKAAATGTFTVTADPVISGGGGGVSSYTVTYNVGEHGKLAEGAKKTESVNYKKSPAKVPEVIANEGYKFLGWSLDGKTVVDPTAEIITKSITFTALYEESAKSLAFEKTITEPYIKGIEENGELLFKPEAPMTRGEVAVMLARTLNLKMDATKDYATNKFPDLKGDEWYAQAVGYLAELGVMKGLEDGTCAAEKYITRAEFVALVMRIDGIVSGENSFPDVSADNWATDYITAASAKGYVDGNEYGNFLPGVDITRASVVKIMNNILGWTEKATGEMLFSDVAGEHWAYGDIVKASTGK